MSGRVHGKQAGFSDCSLQSESNLLWPPREDVIGVQVSCVDYQAAVARIIQGAEHGESGVVSCHSVHAVVTASLDPSLRDMVNEFSMVTPDGQPVRWALNLLHGAGLGDRVYGPELMLRVCRQAAEKQLPIYLYGGSPETLQALERQLCKNFPALRIAGAESPPFRALTDEENEAACQRIHNSGAKIVFIGLGCPKQDYFAAKNANRIPAILMCVGAAFDFHAGTKPTAPSWMQRVGLEWLFRLSCEPRRLWKRYLFTNTIFCVKVVASTPVALMSRIKRGRLFGIARPEQALPNTP
jgi:exopolysaccharide biosynthesis WecB/TagA/CpsF family protein